MEAKSAWAIVHWIRYESVKKHLAEGFIMHEKSGNASLEHLNTAQSSENLFFTFVEVLNFINTVKYLCEVGFVSM